MKRQINTKQMKEQGKNPPDERIEEEIGSLPEKEFRAMIVKMMRKLGKKKKKTHQTKQMKRA